MNQCPYHLQNISKIMCFSKLKDQDWECRPIIEHVLSMHEALGSIPNNVVVITIENLHLCMGYGGGLRRQAHSISKCYQPLNPESGLTFLRKTTVASQELPGNACVLTVFRCWRVALVFKNRLVICKYMYLLNIFSDHCGLLE